MEFEIFLFHVSLFARRLVWVSFGPVLVAELDDVELSLAAVVIHISGTQKKDLGRDGKTNWRNQSSLWGQAHTSTLKQTVA